MWFELVDKYKISLAEAAFGVNAQNKTMWFDRNLKLLRRISLMRQ